jgi:fructose-1,6-bisphosphatase/inositol monophosphatase family enzyme
MIEILREALGVSAKVYDRFGNSYDKGKTKGPFARDIVTKLDSLIDLELKAYFHKKKISFLSEESTPRLPKGSKTFAIVDPLDGSLNWKYKLGCHGTIIGLVLEGQLLYGGICSHSEGVTIHSDSLSNKYSRAYALHSLNEAVTDSPAPCFLALGPTLNSSSRLSFDYLINADPRSFPGFHRLGSVAHGVLSYLAGKYSSLIILNVRIWDIAGTLPLISAKHPDSVYVSVSNEGISVVSGSPNLAYKNTLDKVIESLDAKLFDKSTFTKFSSTLIYE